VRRGQHRGLALAFIERRTERATARGALAIDGHGSVRS
jgi:hypothetical protein